MCKVLAAILCLMASLATAAQGSVFYTGNDLWPILLAAERSESNYANTSVADAQWLALANGFVAGVSDTQFNERLCIPGPGVSVGQARAVATNYMRAHPDQRDKPASVLVILALMEVWACKR